MGDLLSIKHKSFTMKAKSETEAEIALYGAIGDYWFDDNSVTAAEFVKELKNLPDTIKNISLRVNSPGGDVFDGMTIYNRLKQHPAKVTAYVDGIAASIASIIIMSADEILMGEAAQVMIHKPMSGFYGNSNEMQEVIDRLDLIEEQMLSIYTKKTGLDREELRTMLAKETWMSSESAVELGFATSIVDQELKIAAYDISNASWIKNKDAAKRCFTEADLAKEKIGEAITSLTDFLKS